jgi:hypothetical protein
MALKVVGSGLGRTGTLSLKGALEALGFGPCHHMVEVFKRPESLTLWIAAAQGKPDWDTIFREFNAMVDYPGAKFYRQIAEHYPEAKVVHSVRDPDKWFDSTQATIFSPENIARMTSGPMRAFAEGFMGDLIEHAHDRAYMTAHFRRHDEEVRSVIPKERLLVFEAAQGWEPLCAFLGVPAPQTPFPKVNSTEEFKAMVARGGPPTH